MKNKIGPDGPIFLFHEGSEFLLGIEQQPIGCVLEERRREPVEESRGIGFLAGKKFPECPFDKLLRRDSHRQAYRQFPQPRSQSEEPGVHCPGSHHRDMHVIGFEFVPEGLGEIIDECFGGIVGLNPRHRHPRRHTTHIQYVPASARTHIRREEPRHLGYRHHVELQHQFDAPDIRLAIRIEEEHTGVIDQDIHLVAFLRTPGMETFRRVGKREIGIMRGRPDAKLRCQIVRHLLQLLLLVADEEQVAAIIPRELSSVLKAYAGGGTCD